MIEEKHLARNRRIKEKINKKLEDKNKNVSDITFKELYDEFEENR